MTKSIGMIYAEWRAIAVEQGWPVPPQGSRTAQSDWYEAWARYWVAMDDYERRKAAGEPNVGRPVIPHRSGGPLPWDARSWRAEHD